MKESTGFLISLFSVKLREAVPSGTAKLRALRGKIPKVYDEVRRKKSLALRHGGTKLTELLFENFTYNLRILCKQYKYKEFRIPSVSSVSLSCP